MSEVEHNGESNKFAHLLKPIKDLADNFDVNIAAELVEYLEELDKIVINFEGGELNLNFAEAALLIQGSTMVYSKKVEHLYGLVFKVLDLLCDGKVTSNDHPKQTSRRKSMLQIHSEERDNFLLLDDVISIGNNINLAHDDLDESQGLRERVPIALVASRSHNTETSAAFKMMSCDVDASGAFLLERAANRKSHIDTTQVDTIHEGDEEEEDENRNMHDDNDNFDFDQHNEYDHAHDDGDEMAFSTNGDFQDDDNMSHDQLDESQLEETTTWDRLDPHDDTDEAANIPLAVAKTWKTPKVLQSKKDAAASRKKASGELLFTNFLISIALQPHLANQIPSRDGSVLYPEFQQYAANRRKLKRKPRKAKKRGALLPAEFAQHERDLALEDEEDELVANLAYRGGDSEDIGVQDSNDSDQVYYPGSAFDDDQGEDVFGFENQEQDDLQPNRLDLDAATFDGPQDTYVDMVKAHLQQYLATANKWATESKLHTRVRTWEERIEPILEEQNQHPPFNIHAYGSRILQGLTSDQDDPAIDGETLSFDELSAKLGNMSFPQEDYQFDNDNDSHKQSIDEPKPLEQFEVCRLFLASLQLANNGNVELVHETNNSELRFKLLDEVLANERLQGYRAPSVGEKKSKKSRGKRPRKENELENM